MIKAAVACNGRLHELRKVKEEYFEEAQNEATIDSVETLSE